MPLAVLAPHLMRNHQLSLVTDEKIHLNEIVGVGCSIQG